MAANTGLRGLSIHTLAIDPATPTILYAGTALDVFKSTDGGATWVELNNSGTYYDLAIDPATPTTLYAGTNGGVLKSTDGGVSFRNTGSPNTAHLVPW